jgi:hypothetical protein
MLLKSAILHRGGAIREKRAKETIGFDSCVRRGLSTGKIKFLDEKQALLLQAINGLRDAAQHHLLDMSEGHLYMHAQAAVTLFRDLLRSVFGKDVREFMPERVLPISTSPPVDLVTLFDSEINEIKKLLSPGRRRKLEAEARLRPLAILDTTIAGQKGQPSTGDLRRIGQKLLEGQNWQDLFRGASAIEFTSDGAGSTVSLRLSKKEGIPIELVPEGTPGASVVAIKRVDELGYYNLGAKDLAEKCGMTIPKIVMVVGHLGLRGDLDCYKEFRIGKTVFKRYSQKAIERIRSCLEQTNVDEIWKKVREKTK